MKSFKLLALLAVLGLGACSVSDDKFLDKVKGKSVYASATVQTTQVTEFSSDGKTFFNSYKFDSASDENTAIYKIGTAESTFKIDGQKLTIETSGIPIQTLFFPK